MHIRRDGSSYEGRREISDSIFELACDAAVGKPSIIGKLSAILVQRKAWANIRSLLKKANKGWLDADAEALVESVKNGLSKHAIPSDIRTLASELGSEIRRSRNKKQE